jgi:hypothetical protein
LDVAETMCVVSAVGRGVQRLTGLSHLRLAANRIDSNTAQMIASVRTSLSLSLSLSRDPSARARVD